MTAHASPELAGAVLFTLLVLGFTAVAAALGRRFVTAPLAFVAIGAILGFTLGPVSGTSMSDLKLIAELTLVLILFHDAAQARPREIGSDGSFYARLLLIGFPLAILAGYALASALFPTLPAMMLLLLAAALAPTDAGLGAPTILNPVVPTRIRRALNVESGLNDGLATPIVLFAIASLAGAEGLGPGESSVDALIDLALGVAAGGLVGAGGGTLLGWSRRHRMSTMPSRALGVLMIPFLAYGIALMLSGNGFVAAFISGTAFAGSAGWAHDERTALLGAEGIADLLGFAVWLGFGLVAVPLVLREVGWREALFAVLALTVVRMVPVAVSMIGTGMRAHTVVFVGWFGPRGLASVVFALIALESLDIDDNLRTVLATISLTVLLSVVAHGFSAQPLAARYGAWVARVTPPEELRDLNHAVTPRTRGARVWL